MIDFFAKPSGPRTWPVSWFANFDGSLEEAKLAAKATIEQKIFPLAERFEISDHEGHTLYEWPETARAQRPQR